MQCCSQVKVVMQNPSLLCQFESSTNHHQSVMYS
nr:MAG TPA: hypothetical protein [Crassvirales sp.]